MHGVDEASTEVETEGSLTMRNLRRIAPLALCVLMLNAGVSSAALIDRGSGLIYDDILDVTWLQDANYALTTGASESGRMNWTDATAWASSLQYVDETRGTVWADWRLPSTVNSLSSWGWDPSGQNSEMAFMYYVNLGYAPNFTLDRTTPEPTSSDYNPFINLQYRGYWSGTTATDESRAWYMHWHFGSQEYSGINGDELFIWLVRDGDVGAGQTVSSVPEPTSLALVGLGLAGFGWSRRRASSARQ